MRVRLCVCVCAYQKKCKILLFPPIVLILILYPLHCPGVGYIIMWPVSCSPAVQIQWYVIAHYMTGIKHIISDGGLIVKGGRQRSA